MLRTLYIATTAAILSFVSSNLLAGSYGGISVSSIDYSEEGINDDASLTAVSGKIGSMLNENFGFEIRVGTGIADDDVPVVISGLNVDVNVELKSFYGAYIKGLIPISDKIHPYVILGYTHGKVEYSASYLGLEFSDDSSESDVSFGAGFDIYLSESSSLNLEYLNWFDKDGTEISGLSIGIEAKIQ